MSYYDRTSATHLDGSSVFQTVGDRKSESEIAALIEQSWRCEVKPFGALAPVDWYAQRHGRLVGVLELKSRSHARQKYPTVFLNVRKWLALALAGTGLGVPAIFVVRFTDGAFWAPLSKIDAGNNRVAGCVRRVKSDNDIEPVIDVPAEILKPLGINEDHSSSEKTTGRAVTMRNCGA